MGFLPEETVPPDWLDIQEVSQSAALPTAASPLTADCLYFHTAVFPSYTGCFYIHS